MSTWYHAIVNLDLVFSLGRYKYICKEETKGTYYIALELSNPQAVDGATYKLHAKNANGESNANLNLNFDGKCRNIFQLILSYSFQQMKL